MHSCQFILCVWRCPHRSQYLCYRRPWHRWENCGVSRELLPGARVHQLSSAPSLGLGTNYDYVREFKRSTGTWHHTKPLLPSDLRRTGCAALRIANCKLFRLQLQQGLFRIRVHSPWRGRGAKCEILPQAHHVAGRQQAQRSSSILLCAGHQYGYSSVVF